ncbi:MAG: hypothetical protein JWO03_3713 [Bacteroidetes bacterium]|nr:hypothetical protein [Bacteroidota bacterium]
MKLPIIIVVGLLISMRCCAGNTPTISERDIYDFMQMVVKDQKLSKALYLDVEPATHCGTRDDNAYLPTLDSALIPKEEEEMKSSDTTMVKSQRSGYLIPLEKKMYHISVSSEIGPCLNKQDIAFMLDQRTKLSSFKWDQSRLGFSKKSNLQLL